MLRRNLFKTLAAGAAGALAATRAAAAGVSERHATKVAYHLSDADKVGFVLGNIQNHVEGTGGPGKVDIVLVVHGPALKAFHAISANAEIEKRLASLRKDGLQLNACGNTMNAQAVKLDDLLPGFVRVDEGGVVRLADLQAQGYAYLRP